MRGNISIDMERGPVWQPWTRLCVVAADTLGRNN